MERFDCSHFRIRGKTPAVRSEKPPSEPQEVAVAENVFGASGSLQAITSIGTITVTTS